MDKTYKNLLRLNSIVKETNKIYSNAARKFGMSDSVFWILYALREKDEAVTQSEICYAMCQPKQTVNTALKKMESNGLITFENSSDRRSKFVRLTESGIRLAEKTADKVIAAERDTMSQFTQEEQETYIKLMKKYGDLMKKFVEKIP